MADSYDVVVVGAGYAGALLSRLVASEGFRVLLVDRKREEELGADSLELVEREVLERHAGRFLDDPGHCFPLKRIEMMSPDAETTLQLATEPFVLVDRRALTAHLVGMAADAGVEMITQCTVGGTDIEKGSVVSVSSDRGSFPCTLAVGASGLDRVLCKDLPRGMGIPRRLRTSDYLSIYKETRDLGADAKELPGDGVFRYHAGRYGGYSWVYTHGAEIDMGTGIQGVEGYPEPRDIVLGFVRSNPAVGDNVRTRAAGRVPTRRPLSTMVYSGLMVVGDAACQALPLFARGVEGALTGASIASRTAVEALKKKDVSASALWPYNHEYMVSRGARMAALDCLRLFMQGLPVRELSWSMAKGAVDAHDISRAMQGDFEVPTTQARLKKMLKGFKGVQLLVRYDNLLRLAQKTTEHYLEYPGEYDPPEFTEWCNQADYLLEDALKI